MRDFVDPMGSAHTKGDGWVTGILLGLFLPFPAGLIYMQLYPSFENGPILLGAVFMAAPSGIGGGIAGACDLGPGETLPRHPSGHIEMASGRKLSTSAWR